MLEHGQQNFFGGWPVDAIAVYGHSSGPGKSSLYYWFQSKGRGLREPVVEPLWEPKNFLEAEALKIEVNERAEQAAAKSEARISFWDTEGGLNYSLDWLSGKFADTKPKRKHNDQRATSKSAAAAKSYFDSRTHQKRPILPPDLERRIAQKAAR